MGKLKETENPLMLRVLIYSFLVAPFGNIALTAMFHGIEDWYHPVIFINIVTQIADFDLAWLGLIFLVGVLLTTRHRTAWLSAILVLSLTVLINMRNLYSIIQADSFEKMSIIQTCFSLMITLAVGVIFYYFRYPYLDRRSTLLGFAPRFNVNIPSQIFSNSVSSGANCQSLSISGARLLLTDNSIVWAQGDEIHIQFADSTEKFEALVIKYSENILRLRFVGLSASQKSLLIQLAKKYNQGKSLPEHSDSIKTAV